MSAADVVLGVLIAALIIAVLIAWSAWVGRLDRRTYVEAFDRLLNEKHSMERKPE